MNPPQGETEEVAICGTCHDRQAAEHGRSLHGRAAARGDALAPSCVTCHEHHAILPSSNLDSPTSKLNVPLLCGRCHHEGTDVSMTRDIPQDRILENYSQSIHGVGLFKKGLTVTAVCTSCHTSHDILEHTDPGSSIHRENVARTCMVCHSRIEEVHVKVVEGRLWRSSLTRSLLASSATNRTRFDVSLSPLWVQQIGTVCGATPMKISRSITRDP